MSYRDKAEMASWAARDPILRLHRHLTELGVKDAALARIEADVRDELDQVLARAVSAASPAADRVLEKVLGDLTGRESGA